MGFNRLPIFRAKNVVCRRRRPRRASHRAAPSIAAWIEPLEERRLLAAVVDLQFEPQAGIGGPVYEATASGTLAAQEASEIFQAVFDAGQSLAISLSGGAGLQAEVELLDGGGNPVASAMASVAGEQVVLLPTAVHAGETYSIRVANAIDSGGLDASFELHALVNVVFESEALGGLTNDDAQTAQVISEISHPVGNGEFVGILGSMQDGDEDWYRLEVGENHGLFLGIHWLTPPVNELVFLEIFDEFGNPLGSNTNSTIDNFAAQYDTINPFGEYNQTYLIRVSGGSQGDYRLLVMRDAVYETVDRLGANQALLPDVAVVGKVAAGESDRFELYGESGENWILRLEAPFAGPGQPSVVSSVQAEISYTIFDDFGQPITETIPIAMGEPLSIPFPLNTFEAVQLRVFGDGEYVFEAERDTRFYVASTEPAAGSSFDMLPFMAELRFNAIIYPFSIDPNDVLIDGVGGLVSTSIGQTQGALTIQIREGLAPGEHVISIPEGQILGTLAMVGNEAFETTFVYAPPPGPKIVASTILNEDQLPAGDFTLTLTFDQPIRQLGNEILEDLYLRSESTGGQILATQFRLSVDATQLEIDFADVPDDRYIFALFSESITDDLGLYLDGEADPTTTIPSGDGVGGGDFEIHFTVGETTGESPRFEPLLPLGSGMYEMRIPAEIVDAAEVNEHRFLPPPGRFLSVVAVPDNPAARLRVTLGESAEVVEADAAGAAVVLNGFSAERVVTVTSDLPTSYELRIGQNVLYEGSDVADGSEFSFEAYEHIHSFDDPSLRSVLGNSQIDAGADVDEFTFTVLPDDRLPFEFHQMDIVLAGQHGADFSSATLELLDSDGQSVLATATSAPLGVEAANFDLGLLRVHVPQPGQYTLRVTSNVAGDYGLAIAERAVFDTEVNDSDSDNLRLLDAIGRYIENSAFGYVGAADGAIDPLGDRYLLLVEAGVAFEFNVFPLNGSGGALPVVSVYNDLGQLIARTVGRDSGRASTQAEADGFFTLVVEADGAAANYWLAVTEVFEPRVLRSTVSSRSVETALSFQLDTNVLNLYGDAATAPAPPFSSFVSAGGQLSGEADVRLVGDRVGNVAGSLVWDSETQLLRFVKTGGPLEPDDYTFTLRSDSDGIVSSQGVLLDGDLDGTPGGDYVERFTIGLPVGRQLTLRDIVRARSQTIDLQGSGGLPIGITEGFNLRDVRFVLRYDPSLLEVGTVALAENMPPEWFIESAPGSEPGFWEIHLVGDPLPGIGPADLVVVAARVAENAEPGAASRIFVESIELNEGDFTPRSDEAVQVAAFVGDVSFNGDYSALDASLIARVAVALDDGFAAFPLIDPLLIGDVTGDGTISALDASWVARKAVGLPQSEIPDLTQSPQSPPPFDVSGSENRAFAAEIGPIFPKLVVMSSSPSDQTAPTAEKATITSTLGPLSVLRSESITRETLFATIGQSESSSRSTSPMDVTDDVLDEIVAELANLLQ